MRNKKNSNIPETELKNTNIDVLEPHENLEIHKKLDLQRPLCFIDLETTGLDVEKDRIVEISISKLFPDGNREIRTKRFNPEYPISPDATEKHGITNEMVKDEPKFKQLAKGILNYITGCDIAGYNINAYDAPLLYTEFQRAGVNYDYNEVRFIDSCNIFKKNEARTLEAAYKFYLDKQLENSHNSSVDILATIEVFEEQLKRYPELPNNLDDLNLFCNYDKERVDISGKFSLDEDGDIVFNFGSHKGKKAKSEPGFLNWMVSKAKFSEDVNKIVHRLLKEIG